MKVATRMAQRRDEERGDKLTCWYQGTSEGRWSYLHSHPGSIRLFVMMARFMDASNRFPASRKAVGACNGGPLPDNYYRSVERLVSGKFIARVVGKTGDYFMVDPRLACKMPQVKVWCQMITEFLERIGEDVAIEDRFRLDRLFLYTEQEGITYPLGGSPPNRSPLADPSPTPQEQS